MNLFIAGVGTVELFKGSRSVLVSKTLIDSSINLSVSLEDIRAGAGAKLYGKYAHSSGMTMKLTDAMFRMEFLASNIGADVELGGTAVASTQKIVLNNAVIDIVDFIPCSLYPNADVVVWIAKAGQTDYIPFIIHEGDTSIDVSKYFIEGDKICVRYIKANDGGETLTISANFIPDTLTAVLTAPLFAGDNNNLETSTKVGVLTITIPRFMLNGTTDLSMTMTGATQMTLEGSALAVESSDCDKDGYYAIITQTIGTGSILDGLKYIGMEPPETVEDFLKFPLSVMGFYTKEGAKRIAPKFLNVDYFGDERTVTYDKTTGMISVNPWEANEEFMIRITVGSVPDYNCTVYLSYNESTGFVVENKLEGVFDTDKKWTITPKGEMILEAMPSSGATLTVLPNEVQKPIVQQVILKNFEDITPEVFNSYDNVTDLNIADTMTTIKDHMFANSMYLKKVKIPDSVERIEAYAFSNCEGLEKMDISDNVVSIGEYAFEECHSLTDINIPSKVTSINAGTFMNCTSLSEIDIPDNVIAIGQKSFMGCSSLNDVIIPNGIKYLNLSTFENCISLTNVIIPDGLLSIGNNVFTGCSSLTSISIPDSVTSIGVFAFRGCIRLIDLTIPDSVISIGARAFQNCRGLINITIPENVTTIGDNAFQSCVKMSEYTLLPTTPPTLASATLSGKSGYIIKVPSESVEDYKQATNWSTYANKIQAI